MAVITSNMLVSGVAVPAVPMVANEITVPGAVSGFTSGTLGVPVSASFEPAAISRSLFQDPQVIAAVVASNYEAASVSALTWINGGGAVEKRNETGLSAAGFSHPPLTRWGWDRDEKRYLEANDHKSLRQLYECKAKELMKKGDYDQAATFFGNAAEHTSTNFFKANLLCYQADALVKAKQYLEAANIYTQARRMYEESNLDPEQLVSLLFDEATAYEQAAAQEQANVLHNAYEAYYIAQVLIDLQITADEDDKVSYDEMKARATAKMKELIEGMGSEGHRYAAQISCRLGHDAATAGDIELAYRYYMDAGDENTRAGLNHLAAESFADAENVVKRQIYYFGRAGTKVRFELDLSSLEKLVDAMSLRSLALASMSKRDEAGAVHDKASELAHYRDLGVAQLAEKVRNETDWTNMRFTEVVREAAEGNAESLSEFIRNASEKLGKPIRSVELELLDLHDATIRELAVSFGVKVKDIRAVSHALFKTKAVDYITRAAGRDMGSLHVVMNQVRLLPVDREELIGYLGEDPAKIQEGVGGRNWLLAHGLGRKNKKLVERLAEFFGVDIGLVEKLGEGVNWKLYGGF